VFSRFTLILLLAAGSASAQDDSARQALRHAVELQQSGHFAEAIDAYRAFLKAHPEAAPVRSNLGAALAHEGRYPEAIDQYKLALDADPSNVSIRFNRGLAWYKMGEAAEAVHDFEAVYAAQASDDPNRERLALLLAECYLRQGENDRVVALLDPIAAADPQNHAADYVLGTALLHQGQTERGALLIQRLLQNGDTAEAHMLMAYTQLKANDKKAAMDEVNRALALNPNLPEGYTLRGRLAYLQSDMQGAEASFMKAADLDPASFDARLWLGTLLREQGRLDLARTNLERALQFRPKDLRARYQFARLCSDEGDDKQAAVLLQALEKDSPDFLEVHRTLATIYFRLGRPDEGRKERKIAEDMDAAIQKQNEAKGRSLTK
jgi:tetratricopeptide (TPR) repeat protein